MSDDDNPDCEGWNTDMFVDPVDDDFICAICSEVLRNAVETQCGHAYCAKCITEWLRTNSTCPIDQYPLTTDMLRNMVRDRRRILSLKVLCPACRQCLELGEWRKTHRSCQRPAVGSPASVDSSPDCRTKRAKSSKSPHSLLHQEGVGERPFGGGGVADRAGHHGEIVHSEQHNTLHITLHNGHSGPAVPDWVAPTVETSPGSTPSHGENKALEALDPAEEAFRVRAEERRRRVMERKLRNNQLEAGKAEGCDSNLTNLTHNMAQHIRLSPSRGLLKELNAHPDAYNGYGAHATIPTYRGVKQLDGALGHYLPSPNSSPQRLAAASELPLPLPLPLQERDLRNENSPAWKQRDLRNKNNPIWTQGHYSISPSKALSKQPSGFSLPEPYTKPLAQGPPSSPASPPPKGKTEQQPAIGKAGPHVEVAARPNNNFNHINSRSVDELVSPPPAHYNHLPQPINLPTGPRHTQLPIAAVLANNNHNSAEQLMLPHAGPVRSASPSLHNVHNGVEHDQQTQLQLPPPRSRSRSRSRSRGARARSRSRRRSKDKAETVQKSEGEQPLLAQQPAAAAELEDEWKSRRRWSCAQCTYQNRDGQATRCSVCGAARERNHNSENAHSSHEGQPPPTHHARESVLFEEEKARNQRESLVLVGEEEIHPLRDQNTSYAHHARAPLQRAEQKQMSMPTSVASEQEWHARRAEQRRPHNSQHNSSTSSAQQQQNLSSRNAQQSQQHEEKADRQPFILPRAASASSRVRPLASPISAHSPHNHTQAPSLPTSEKKNFMSRHMRSKSASSILGDAQPALPSSLSLVRRSVPETSFALPVDPSGLGIWGRLFRKTKLDRPKEINCRILPQGISASWVSSSFVKSKKQRLYAWPSCISSGFEGGRILFAFAVDDRRDTHSLLLDPLGFEDQDIKLIARSNPNCGAFEVEYLARVVGARVEHYLSLVADIRATIDKIEQADTLVAISLSQPGQEKVAQKARDEANELKRELISLNGEFKQDVGDRAAAKLRDQEHKELLPNMRKSLEALEKLVRQQRQASAPGTAEDRVKWEEQLIKARQLVSRREKVEKEKDIGPVRA
eukprot:g52959.t1